MNFSRVTIETAAGFCDVTGRTLADPTPESIAPTAAATALAMAVRWGGVDPEELNTLARICGHPLAPDLPGWMTALKGGI